MTPSFLEFDYPIIRACLNHEPYAWENFVDRFMNLTLSVIDHSAKSLETPMDDDLRAELCEAIFRSYRYNEYQLLREFSFKSSASAYLVVIARRLTYAFLQQT